EFLFYAPPPSRQSEAVAEVARRVHSSLRLDLLEKIAPSDLWLRTCCILRRDRSSQGYPRAKNARRTLAGAAALLAKVRSFKGKNHVHARVCSPTRLHRRRLRSLALRPPRDFPPRGPPARLSALRVRGIPPGLPALAAPLCQPATRPRGGAFSHPHRRRRPVRHQPESLLACPAFPQDHHRRRAGS